MTNNNHLQLHDILRMAAVDRWTLLNKTKRQSVAEHSFTVTIIAMHLWATFITNAGEDPAGMLALVRFAMFHDKHETRTGDVPTPGKVIINSVAGRDVFKDYETMVDAVHPFNNPGNGDMVNIQRIVKMADQLEAAAWIRENGVGEHARVIAGKQHTRLVELVERANAETGWDWYAPINEILMALGAPVIQPNSWIHRL